VQRGRKKDRKKGQGDFPIRLRGKDHGGGKLANRSKEGSKGGLRGEGGGGKKACYLAGKSDCPLAEPLTKTPNKVLGSRREGKTGGKGEGKKFLQKNQRMKNPTLKTVYQRKRTNESELAVQW